jgi:hypothetical protein
VNYAVTQHEPPLHNTQSEPSVSSVLLDLTKAIQSVCGGGKRHHRQSSLEDEEEDNENRSHLSLPKSLQDIALTQVLNRKLTQKRICDIDLATLLDKTDLMVEKGSRGRNNSSDRLVKAVIILVRYRYDFHPVETNDVLHFLFQVQDLVCNYNFEVVT